MINIYKKSDLIFEPDSPMTVTNIFISKLFIGLNILLDASYLIRLAKNIFEREIICTYYKIKVEPPQPEKVKSC